MKIQPINSNTVTKRNSPSAKKNQTSFGRLYSNLDKDLAAIKDLTLRTRIREFLDSARADLAEIETMAKKKWGPKKKERDLEIRAFENSEQPGEGGIILTIPTKDTLSSYISWMTPSLRNPDIKRNAIPLLENGYDTTFKALKRRGIIRQLENGEWELILPTVTA